MDKDIDAFRTISEAAEDLELPQHVLRFWELRFPQIKPMKRSGGRRYYRPDDIELLREIKHLLYGEGYTIKGVQRILKEQGVRAVAGAAQARTGEPASLRQEPAFKAERTADEPTSPSASRIGEGERAQAAPRMSLGVNQTRQLRALLADIEECERILVAAREP